MLDPGYVRQHLDEVALALRKRGSDPALLEPLRDLDAKRRRLLVEVEGLKKNRNESSRRIGEIMKSGGDASAMREETRQAGERIASLEDELNGIEVELRSRLEEIPNLPHASVPEGHTPEDNAVVRTWGEPPRFGFEPKAHFDLGPELGILDFERAARMTGARFALSMGDGARLERALIQFML